MKSDVVIAKNYLNAEHLKNVERIVTAYLGLAETRAINRELNQLCWDFYSLDYPSATTGLSNLRTTFGLLESNIIKNVLLPV